MKRFLLVLMLSGLSACAHPTFQSPVGQKAYTADQIVVRVNELENAAIAANTSKALSDDATRPIVEFCVAADKTLAATPNGWQATLETAWTAAKAKIGTVSNPAVMAAIGAVDVILGSVK